MIGGCQEGQPHASPSLFRQRELGRRDVAPEEAGSQADPGSGWELPALPEPGLPDAGSRQLTRSPPSSRSLIEVAAVIAIFSILHLKTVVYSVSSLKGEKKKKDNACRSSHRSVILGNASQEM